MSPAELDALEAKLAADPERAFQVVNDEPNARELLLAGQQERPTSQFWGLYVKSLFQRQEPGADELAAEARAKHYQDWSDYLQQFHEAVVGALEEAPGEARLQFALSCVRGPLAVAAMETGDLGAAKQHADQWLQGNTDTKSWNYGNVAHDANQVLGRVALREGDVPEAGRFLIEAGKTPGSPQLNSFGPRMTLARELLEKGEKAVVLEYVDLVAKFWASPESRAPDDERGRRLMQDNAATVERWKVLIAAGLIPDSRHWR